MQVPQSELDADFAQAVGRVSSSQSRPGAPRIGTEVQEVLYVLYKQACFGDNVASRPFGMFSPRKLRKWEAWNRFRGVSVDDAKKRYIHVAATVAPAAYGALQ